MAHAITITFGGDEALRLIFAIDVALTALALPALEHGLEYGEINDANIRLRQLRQDLWMQRNAALSEIIANSVSKAKGRGKQTCSTPTKPTNQEPSR